MDIKSWVTKFIVDNDIKFPEHLKNQKSYTRIEELHLRNPDDTLLLYLYGYTKEQMGDINAATKYYTMASTKNFSMPTFTDVTRHYKHEKIPVKLDDAVEYYRLAAEIGISNGLNNFAVIRYQNHSTSDAIEYFKLAIKKNNVDAMVNLGDLYQTHETSINGYDFQKALKYYKMATIFGHSCRNRILNIFVKKPDLIIEDIIDSYKKDIDMEKQNKKIIIRNWEAIEDIENPSMELLVLCIKRVLNLPI